MGSGLVSAPLMKHLLAAYLAPVKNSGIAGTPTLLMGPCRFSFKQLGRNYSDQACTARVLSTMSLLQTYLYQATCLVELSKAVTGGGHATCLWGKYGPQPTTYYVRHVARWCHCVMRWPEQWWLRVIFG